MEQETIYDLIKYFAVLISVLTSIFIYIYIRRSKNLDKKDDAIKLGKENSIDPDLLKNEFPKGCLLVKTTFNGVLIYPLELGRNDVGRNPPANYNSIQIIGKKGPDFYMSRFHFTILVLQEKNKDFQYFIYDEMSSNGTIVNNVEIGKKLIELKDNSVITAGETDVIFKRNISSQELESYSKSI